MKVQIFLTFSLLACAPTPHAIKRRYLEAKLENCIHRSFDATHCFQEAHKECRAAGLEKTCASDGLYSNPGAMR